MFRFIVESVQAYNQVGFFIGALICLGLGGLIFGNALYWRVQAARAMGTVIGVIDRGGMYTPVYRYTLGKPTRRCRIPARAGLVARKPGAWCH
jgi:hypothetical protein